MRNDSYVDHGNVADPVLVVTVGRSGMHLIIDALRYQFAKFGLRKLPGQPVFGGVRAARSGRVG